MDSKLRCVFELPVENEKTVSISLILSNIFHQITAAEFSMVSNVFLIISVFVIFPACFCIVHVYCLHATLFAFISLYLLSLSLSKPLILFLTIIFYHLFSSSPPCSTFLHQPFSGLPYPIRHQHPFESHLIHSYMQFIVARLSPLRSHTALGTSTSHPDMRHVYKLHEHWEGKGPVVVNP